MSGPAFTVEADLRTINNWVVRYVEELGVNVYDMMRYEMRLCLRDCIKWSTPATYAKGREGVRRDYSRASKPIQTLDFSRAGKRTQERIEEVIANRDGAAANAILKDMGSKQTVVPFSPSLFRDAQRGANGKIKSTGRLVFEQAAWRADLAKTQKHVGRRKAGWLPGFYDNGGSTVANWINQHLSGARGSVQHDKSILGPNVTATNFAVGIRNTLPTVRRAVSARARAIAKDFRYFQRGKKNVEDIG